MNLTVYVSEKDKVILKDAKDAASKLDISLSSYIMLALNEMNFRTNKVLRIK